jgi:membrane protein YdbS with pleckstrin-like domain
MRLIFLSKKLWSNLYLQVTTAVVLCMIDMQIVIYTMIWRWNKWDVNVEELADDKMRSTYKSLLSLLL